jgi:hypothetical protein
MRGTVSEGGVNSLAGRRVEGMEKLKRARRRKRDTAKADLKPPLAVSGGQGVRREVESEGHEEKYRAVIEGEPAMNRSANGGDRSSLLHSGEGVLIHPTSTTVCADGTVRKRNA